MENHEYSWLPSCFFLHSLSTDICINILYLINLCVSLQAATFDYNLVYEFARAVSDEVRSKVSELMSIFSILYQFENFVSGEEILLFF